MSVTLQQIATQLNLHSTTVSRILRGKGDSHSEQTKQRVLAAAAELGYQPNPAARALKTGATQMVALWLLSLENYSPYYGYVHHCLQRLGRQHVYHLITEDVPHADGQRKNYSQLIRWPVDGIITYDLPAELCVYARSVMGRRCPIVCVGQADVPDTDRICVDNYAGARQAVEHLLLAGCERIAFACLSINLPSGQWTDPRAAAYADVLREAGREPEYIAVETDSRSGGYKGLKAYVAEHGCPDGLFCFNDETAIGCTTALHEMGIRVPDDVLLVGFDGLEHAQFCPTPISSVEIPVEQMCSLAWEMLLRRIAEPQAPFQQRALTPHLEIRASSRR